MTKFTYSIISQEDGSSGIWEFWLDDFDWAIFKTSDGKIKDARVIKKNSMSKIIETAKAAGFTIKEITAPVAVLQILPNPVLQ